MIERWKTSARRIKGEIRVLYLAYKDERVPWYAKVFAACVVAYAFSPVDLIPDFIPILGYVDDLIIVPFGIVLAMKMIPSDVLEDCRRQAEQESIEKKPSNWFVGGLFILIWITLALWISIMLYRMFK
ncbi:MAG: DUF1232 domain-containing protein [Bacillales bacterium]|nr:DUF1232 domain-containing protein [Bacillales bacterium]